MKVLEFLSYLVYYMKNMVEGWILFFIDFIARRPESRIAKQRYAICKNCEFMKKGVCGKCGCFILAKIRPSYLIDYEGKSIGGCPERKW